MTKWLITPAICGVLCLTASLVGASELRETPAVKAYKRASASVVNIHTEKSAQERDSVFASSRGRKINGMGTGIVIDERGYIVTNHHVVAEVELIRATFEDGSDYDARVVAIDKEQDLAVIKVEATKAFKVAAFGTSSDIYLAERVLAIGNAYGYRHTVTEGIVSALGRDVEVNETQSYRNLIQTDASINPGNSGGPLINMDGDVIGVNVAIRAGAQRIGFAIPIDDARKVVARLISVEQMGLGYHGAILRDLKTPTQKLLVVENVLTDSPAQRAGLKAGDVLLKAGLLDTADAVDFERSLLGRKPGEALELVVRRNDHDEKLNFSLGQASISLVQNQVARTAIPGQLSEAETQRFWQVLGLKLAPIVPDQKVLAGTRYRGGLRVVDVRSDSPAATNGIAKGDILVGLHDWETLSVENVTWIVNKSSEIKLNPIKFYIVRGQETLFGHLQTASR
ncbi:MAG: serine protease [Planctomyces sp.]|nr:serine protease [Planctomyces sp.]